MHIEKYVLTAVSVAAIFGIWYVAAYVTGSDLIVPQPRDVFFLLWKWCRTSSFWISIAATAVRVLRSFCVSIAVSLVLGTAAGCSRRFEYFITPVMTLAASVPMVSVILLAMFWFGSSRVPVFASLVMTIPVMTTAVSSGIRAADRSLVDMCRVYHISGMRRIFHLYIPSFLPSFLSGACTALALSWKVIAAGEVLALPRFGTGTALQTAKIHLDTAGVFAWTMALFCLSALTGAALRCAASYVSRRRGNAHD